MSAPGRAPRRLRAVALFARCKLALLPMHLAALVILRDAHGESPGSGLNPPYFTRRE